MAIFDEKLASPECRKNASRVTFCLAQLVSLTGLSNAVPHFNIHSLAVEELALSGLYFVLPRVISF